jgi:hypothetical protein
MKQDWKIKRIGLPNDSEGLIQVLTSMPLGLATILGKTMSKGP